jgi:TonB family protein
MKQVTLLFLVFCVFAVYADNHDVEDVTKTKNSGTHAVPILHDKPKYPTNALRRGIEGWVIIGFTILPDGTTTDIEVVDKSMEKVFDQAAINAASAWTYKPATRDGKPITQHNKRARMLFSIKGLDNTVSETFRNTYKKALSAIKNGDMATAKALISELDDDEKRMLAEVCYLDVLKARYFEKEGNRKATHKHVERALVLADDVASENIYAYLLKQSVVNNGVLKNYQTSLERYAALQELDGQLAADDPVHGFADRVRKELNGDGYISSNGELRRCSRCKSPRWRRGLNRDRFSIDQVVGVVDEIEIACQNGTVAVAYDPDTVWSVNKKEGGKCFVSVYGEEATTLRLLEHPNSP